MADIDVSRIWTDIVDPTNVRLGAEAFRQSVTENIELVPPEYRVAVALAFILGDTIRIMAEKKAQAADSGSS